MAGGFFAREKGHDFGKLHENLWDPTEADFVAPIQVFQTMTRFGGTA